MSNNPKECPFFVSIGHQQIVCRGMVPGCNLQQGFSEPGTEKRHYAEFCNNAYNRCTTAQMLNDALCEFKVYVCPNNSEVECIHTEECSKCGWDYNVAQARLRRYLEKPGSY